MDQDSRIKFELCAALASHLRELRGEDPQAGDIELYARETFVFMKGAGACLTLLGKPALASEVAAMTLREVTAYFTEEAGRGRAVDEALPT